MNLRSWVQLSLLKQNMIQGLDTVLIWLQFVILKRDSSWYMRAYGQWQSLAKTGKERARILISRWVDNNYNRWVNGWMGSGLLDERVAVYKCTSEGNTPSHIERMNPADSLPQGQLIKDASRSHRSSCPRRLHYLLLELDLVSNPLYIIACIVQYFSF